MPNKSLYLTALAVGLSVGCGGCASQTVKPPTQQNFVDKLSARVKSGTSKVVAAVTPKKTPMQSPVSSPSGEPGPNVFVAVAQLQEKVGNLDAAEANYRKALDLDARHLGALVGYARLEDRRSNFEGATKLYRRAIKTHPKSASVHNDLGLCYHRRGMLPKASSELKRAVDLDGDNKLFRNNLAAVYVEQGMNNEALVHLKAAHGTSVGHYNLAYMLVQKGDRQTALVHFQQAAQIDRNLIAARHWVARLSAPPAPYAAHQAAAAMTAAQRVHGAQPAPGGPPAYVAQRPPQQSPQFAPPHSPQQAPHATQQPRYQALPSRQGSYR